MPFTDDGNPHAIITQALEEGYGQNGPKGPSLVQFYVFFDGPAYFLGFLENRLVAGLWCAAHKYAPAIISIACG